jgi:hypothetical protein
MNYSFRQFYGNFTAQNYGNGARFSLKKILLNSSKLPTLPVPVHPEQMGFDPAPVLPKKATEVKTPTLFIFAVKISKNN